MNVLVIDVGGSHIKFLVWGKTERREFSSGKDVTARSFAQQTRDMTADWKYDAVSIGFPGLVVHGAPAEEPLNLGNGWIKFPYARFFKKPVKIINDAAMQALGSFAGGRMLFLGLGTGLGSTLIVDNTIIPLELGKLHCEGARSLGNLLGKAGLKRLGARDWEQNVQKLVPRLGKAMRADYVVLGGGSVDCMKNLPSAARRGSNDDAFTGGARLWGRARLKASPRKHTWNIA